MLGPGRYDDLCTLVRKRAKAEGVVVIIVGGNRGHGFAVQGDLELTERLPDMLESVARDIRRSLRQGTRQ